MAEPWAISASDIERARQEYAVYLESYEAEEGEAEDDPRWWLGFVVWLQARFKQDTEALCNQLVEGDISLDEWHIAMQERIKTLHIVCAVAGVRGDWDAVNWGAVEERIRGQYEYLEGFREDIREKQEEDEDADLSLWLIARAALYAGSLWAMYHIIEREAERERGRDEVRWVLGVAEHCEDCLELAGRDWMPIDDLGGQVPGDGTTRCRSNCQCHLEYRTVASQQSQLEAAMADWKVGADRDLPIVERDSWDGDAVKARIFAWAGFDGDDPQPGKA
ncbi:MAG: hypothetical protein H8D74_02630, partial [Chloroflexi bacterium]|nr:hypothetical protein [Chloroflexota bacterium]